VFRNKVDPTVVLTVEQIRKQMLADKRTISVCDLGSGSLSLNTKTRKVTHIAKHTPVSRKYGKLLSNMASEFGDKLIIELGTSLGISTMYMAASNPDATVYTMEGCRETAAIAEQNFSNARLGNINMLQGSFDDILPRLRSEGITPGLVFIDGNHRKEPVIKYFNLITEFSDSKTVVIIDDINHSAEMKEAWNTLKNDTRVSVSIDIFQMGILFFREGINRISYTIRY
jgi:predicted O-methyltransferase YrrM